MNWLIKVSFSFLVVLPFFSGCDTEDGDDLSTLEEDIFIKVNEHRMNQGLDELILENYLTLEAREYSEDVGKGRTRASSNVSIEREGRIQRELGEGEVAQIITSQKITANEVLTTWITNLRSKAVVEGEYTHAGMGVYRHTDGINYFTLMVLNSSR